MIVRHRLAERDPPRRAPVALNDLDEPQQVPLVPGAVQPDHLVEAVDLRGGEPPVPKMSASNGPPGAKLMIRKMSAEMASIRTTIWASRRQDVGTHVPPSAAADARAALARLRRAASALYLLRHRPLVDVPGLRSRVGVGLKFWSWVRRPPRPPAGRAGGTAGRRSQLLQVVVDRRAVLLVEYRRALGRSARRPSRCCTPCSCCRPCCSSRSERSRVQVVFAVGSICDSQV